MTSHVYGGSKANKSIKEYGKRDKSLTKEAKTRAENFFDLDSDGNIDLDAGFYGGDFWLFVDNEVKIEAKNVDYMGMIDKAIASATDENKGGFTSEEVMNHLISSGGIDKDTLLALLTA